MARQKASVARSPFGTEVDAGTAASASPEVGEASIEGGRALATGVGAIGVGAGDERVAVGGVAELAFVQVHASVWSFWHIASGALSFAAIAAF